MADLPNNGVDIPAHEEVDTARRAAFPDPAIVDQYRNYARGRQRNTLTREARRVLRGCIGNLFCENVLKRLLTVLTDRIVLLDFSVNDKTVKTFLDDVWVRLQIQVLAAELIWATWRDGNSSVVIGWNTPKRRPTICREKWWNGKSGIFFAYDDTGEPIWAVKEWNTPKGRRRTIYCPDRICRYIQSRQGWAWVPWKDKNDVQRTGAQWWTSDGSQTGEPLGIAAVHFARRVEPPDGSEEVKDNARDSNYGVSLYDGGLIGMQDGVNEQHRNILSAARFTAYQIPTAAGVDLGVDEVTKEPRKLEIEPGTGLTSPAPDARFGYIPAGSIEQLLKALMNLLRAMSQSASVPEHLIAGVWPSGAAMMRAEQPLIKQARKGASVVGPAFASLMHKCVLMSNAFGGTNLKTEALITSLFEDPEQYDAMTLTELGNARADNVPLEEVWMLYGYGPDKRKKMRQQMQEEAAWRPAAVPGDNNPRPSNEDTL